MSVKFDKKQKGFTLTESLVVVFIFILILGAVYSAYVLNQQAYRQGETAAELNQNGRVILERMTREIRQAREMVTVLPEERIGPSQEILFQDGHLALVSESGVLQAGATTTCTLSAISSSVNDYYKDMFIKITGGLGSGQVKKIESYNGTTKIAEIEGSWETLPGAGSTYKIDSNYNYIHYYLENSNILRRTIAYYFSGDPNTFVPWNAIPAVGQTMETQILEVARPIGQYVTDLEFWGLRVINIALTLGKDGKSIDFLTKIFGRNL